eukprot:CAMPEP_0181291398 /NCGR_PEP_ID=MMETSP1101-20121128/1945_1 /TAXON_ID=46948 /ORGANISM="Rhodomonas abbreviata, Strain Caron Lab Isolate" /LENGTH=140 /DNA_ID=CAMNT_0023395785 /DNA_START=87 /DNA_END=509 /DNA_ORIENTATION=+
MTGKKFFSTISQSPKIAIAQHIMLLKEIAAAKDDAALSAISTSNLPAIDTENLPAELEDLKTYFALSEASSSETFTPDPTAWQNMSPMAFAATEAVRADTWPFLVGFIVVNLVLGVGLASALPKDNRKNSRYVQLLEGQH